MGKKITAFMTAFVMTALLLAGCGAKKEAEQAGLYGLIIRPLLMKIPPKCRINMHWYIFLTVTVGNSSMISSI